MAKKQTSKPAVPRGRPLESAPQPVQFAFLTSAVELGRSIKQARLYRGLSQADVASTAKVNRRLVVELENGKSSVHLQKALEVMMCVGLVGVVVPAEAMQ